MTIAVWILFGAIVGSIVSILFDNNRSYRMPQNVLVAVIGAVVGGVVAVMIGGGLHGFNLSSLLLAVIGAFCVLMTYRKFAFGRIGA